ncbi:spore germination protein GerW family protein [Herbidospora mongoliensis]|uniref:spore germination protein GerW family protein n=1 Tax=Herbidospora mongoliensis TaxID=688067 RepID=UPI000836A9A7|nr:spore germination protein GerW family protein [Herbidospora mongoliensis]
MNVMELLDKARDHATVRRAFGEPITVDGVTVIPVARIGGGGGGGGGGDRKDGAQAGSGGGFGVGASPVGAYVIKDGEVRWHPAIDWNKFVVGSQIVAVVALLVARSIVRKRARRS